MRQIQLAERHLLDLLDISEFDADIIWNSGGTEANNLAVLGIANFAGSGCFAVESTAHSSLLAPVAYLTESGFDAWQIPVNDNGKLNFGNYYSVDMSQLQLLGVCHVNNETGAIQDICEVRNWLNEHAPSALLLVDALQSFGKMSIDWNEAEIDMLSIGGRKIGGPPEMGALIVRRGTPLKPIMFGGDQQRGMRPGTLNAAAIINFVEVAEAVTRKRNEEWQRITRLNQILRTQISSELNEYKVTAISPTDASPYIFSLALPKYEGAILMRKLSHRGIVVGTGSACSAESGGTSHVLHAMAVEPELARGVLRVSFSHANTENDVHLFVCELRKILADY